MVHLNVIVTTEQTFFNANDAVWPALSSLTGILLRWIVLTWIGWNWPKGSGPSNKVSFSRIVPRRHVPDTTVPTPWKLQKQPFWLIPFTLSLKQLKCHKLSCFGELAHIKELKSYFERWPFVNVNFRLFYDGQFIRSNSCGSLYHRYASTSLSKFIDDCAEWKQLFYAFAIFSRHRFNSHTKPQSLISKLFYLKVNPLPVEALPTALWQGKCLTGTE